MDLLQWVKSKGYAYTWNFKLVNRTPDLIAFNKSKVIAFEIKRYSSQFNTAVGQCISYLQKANSACVVLPIRELEKLQNADISLLKKQGIGLLGVNNRVKVVLEAKFFPRNIDKLLKELEEKSIFTTSSQHKTKEEIKEEIVEILKEHPNGLHILEIARQLGSHRHTVTKYVYELIGSGTIRVREIGTAKLCILEKKRLGK